MTIETGEARQGLLVVPASLLANWKAELQRFAPSLSFRIEHSSETPTAKSRQGDETDARGLDLLITTYGTTTRNEWLRKHDWDLVILDEAQAIKNSGTRQSRTVKELKCSARVAMTGTPVENRLSDLWSLFDFLNPRLARRGQGVLEPGQADGGRNRPYMTLFARSSALTSLRGSQDRTAA